MQFKNLFKNIHKSTGIVFTQNEDIVKKKIIRFYKSKEFMDLKSFQSSLKEDKNLYQELINLITTSETYFFRELSQIEICIKKIKKLSSNVKILSAPCAGGEEPYSILISLIEAGVDLKNIDLYAIDINSNEIQRAKSGIYKARRLHKLSQILQDKYFDILQNKDYKIKANLQKHIHFQEINIFDSLPSKLSNFDIIFSRNMLIYFDESAKLKVEKIFYNLLKTNGFLFLGHADIIQNLYGFTKIIDRGDILYQK